MEGLYRDTILEINLDNIIFNINSIKAMVGKDVALVGVVKANAYGHGADEIAKILMTNGGNCLGVANLSEALDLRKKYKDYRILIMGHTPDEYLDYIVKKDIIQTIFSYKQAELLDRIAFKYNKRARVHIKYDTGFHRLGFRDSGESIDKIIRIFNLKNIYLEGIFSHLALKSKEEDQKQYNKFINVIESLEDMGIVFKYKHIADSISAVDYPEFRMNMIRPGALIYGIKGFHHGRLDLKQALKFKSKISFIKEIKKGQGVSYDYLWKAEEDSIIGVLPFGYGDGYPRNLSNKGYVTITGKKAPIVGLICMDQCMVDLSHIPEVCQGDQVIIYGDGRGNTMDLDTLSKLANTNKNELITRISMRVPRVYIKENRIVNIVNYIG